MKKLLGAVTAMSIMAAGLTVPPVYAADDIKVYVNGRQIYCEQPPLIREGRTLVPVRAICEALGCDVEWDGERQDIHITSPLVSITMGIDQNTMLLITASINKRMTLDVAPQIYNDNTLVPARAIAEATYAEVSWDGDTKSVYITRDYDWVDWLRSGYARMKLGDKWGVIDENGKIVIPATYDYIDSFLLSPGVFNDGLALVAQAQDTDGKTVYKFGFIDKTGKTVIPVEYDSATFSDEGLVCVQKDGKIGFLNTSGREVIPFVYDDAIGVFNEGLTAVQKNGKWGFIDKTGKIVIPFTYDFAGFFYEELGVVKKDGKWGFINNKNKFVIPCMYENVYFFSEGMAAVQKNGKWGYVDKTNKTVIQFIFEDASSFSEDVAAVKYEGKWIYINKDGKPAIDYGFEEADAFVEGLAPVKSNGKWGYIDKSGNLVIKNIYDAAESFDNGYAEVEKDGKKGVINKDGVVIWE